jgi:hypothetical protein
MRVTAIIFQALAIFLALYFLEEDRLSRHNLLDHFTFLSTERSG